MNNRRPRVMQAAAASAEAVVARDSAHRNFPTLVSATRGGVLCKPHRNPGMNARCPLVMHAAAAVACDIASKLADPRVRHGKWGSVFSVQTESKPGDECPVSPGYTVSNSNSST